MKLNKKEKELVRDHKDRGYVYRREFFNYWSTERTVREKIGRFLTIGIIKIGRINDRFEITQEIEW